MITGLYYGDSGRDLPANWIDGNGTKLAPGETYEFLQSQ